MPATPARIGFIMEEYRRAISETATAKTNFGSLARESDDPTPTFLDSVPDAQTIAAERQALLGSPRRRFTLACNSASEIMALDYTAGTIPLGRYIDNERDFDKAVMVSEIAINLGRGTAEVTVWG